MAVVTTSSLFLVLIEDSVLRNMIGGAGRGLRDLSTTGRSTWRAG